MRISNLWALLGLTSANLPPEVAEIIAQSMQTDFMEHVLSHNALLGRRHRRQAEECVDTNNNCGQYISYCDNKSFNTVCKATCGECGKEPNPPTASVSDTSSSADENSNCADTMTYCNAMSKYCNNEEYKGVRMYCKKTCKSCDEDFTTFESAQSTDNDGDECEERSYCSQFSYCHESDMLRDRMINECPIQCRHERCKDKWAVNVTQAPKTSAEVQNGGCVDESQACDGVKPLCREDKYIDTLQTYCRATCEFCKPNENNDAAEPVENGGACVNQYDNCEGMKFLCNDSSNEYSGRYRQMCPVTCKLCEPEGAAAETPVETSPVDPNACEDQAHNCPSLLDYCESDQTAEMMKAQCKKSCGFCQPAGQAVMTTEAPTQAPTGCEDDTSIDCAKYTNFCGNTNTEVPKKCKRTCGLCPDQQQSSTQAPVTEAPTEAPTTPAATTPAATAAAAPVCKDKMPGCGKYAKYCKAPRYKAKLTKSCAKTCKLCPGAPGAATGATAAPVSKAPAPAGECRDNTPKQCPSLKKYCKAPKYKKMMMQKCKSTCGWCDTSGASSAAPSTNAPAKAPAKAPAAAAQGTCRDKNPQCKKYAKRCGMAQVKKLCPKTCNICSSRRRRDLYVVGKNKFYTSTKPVSRSAFGSSPTVSASCADHIGQCKAFSTAGFCKSTDPSTLATMKRACARTCGFCQVALPKLNFGPWSEWSECSKTCDGGYRTRKRTCPLQGRCIGNDSETGICNLEACKAQLPDVPLFDPVNGITGPESSDASCVDSNPDRCSKMALSNCKMDMVKTMCKKTCKDCGSPASSSKIDSLWSPWGKWTTCQGSCSGGFQQNRARTCQRGKCEGKPVEIRSCSMDVDCNFNRDFTCSDIDNQCAKHAGEGRCMDKIYSSWMQRNCQASCRLCPGLAPITWSEWTECSSKCGSGKRERTAGTVVEQKTCFSECSDEEDEVVEMPKVECIDKHRYCPMLGYKCGEKVIFESCHKTCKSCHLLESKAKAPKCKDKNPAFCEHMLGLPSSHTPHRCNEAQYRLTCPHTCHSCEELEKIKDGQVEQDEPEEACEDSYEMCTKSTVRKQCGSNKWIQTNCKLSCGSCSGQPTASAEIVEEKPECKDTTTTCQLWRTMCTSQKIVAEKCPLTCGVCQATPTTPATSTMRTTTTMEVTTPTKESTSFSCIDNPVCKRYASSWELNCRDSEEFQKECPSLCKHPECRDYWYEPEVDNTRKWRMWEQWGECTKECGTGMRTRVRKCIAPSRNPCDQDSLTEDGICNKEPCPDEQQAATISTTASPSTECVDNESCDGMGDFHCSDSHVKSFCPRLCKSCPAQWSQWADWTECSATCAGMGMVTRQRTCVTSEYTTDTCDGDDQETKECEGLDYCYGEWSDYTECRFENETDTCGAGTKSRMRVCSVPEDCTEVEKEVIDCNVSCVGEWSEWSEFTECSATCGSDANKQRTRICPSGLECEGDSLDSVACDLADCIEYYQWNEWQDCDATCGGGMQKRSRDCSVEGQCAKYGPSIESRPCNMEVCPSKAEWGEWEALSPCTVSCGGGFRTTKRQCVNGAIGSEGCSVDEYLKIQSCGTDACEQWSEWSGCSSDCGWGSKSRHRGDQIENMNCWSGICADVGFWSNWSQFVEPCPKGCGGTQKRKRHCINGIPGRGGCPGSTAEHVPCTPCGEWGGWGEWGSCSKTCSETDNPGITTRARACVNGQCPYGEAQQIESCNNQKCVATTKRPITTTITTTVTTTTTATTTTITTTTTTMTQTTTKVVEESGSLDQIPAVAPLPINTAPETEIIEELDGVDDVAPLPIGNKMMQPNTDTVFNSVEEDGSGDDLDF